jgi:hypothetical protein
MNAWARMFSFVEPVEGRAFFTGGMERKIHFCADNSASPV